MNEIVEIFGEKKFSGAKNSELKTRLLFEESQKINYENNLFYDISQQTQFLAEKQSSSNFRFYGTINPILCLNSHVKTNDSDIRINIDRNIFDFNLKNWSIVLLKSKSITFTDTRFVSKGVKLIEKFDNNKPVFTIDLKRGLPAKIFVSKSQPDNYGLYFPLGHNFQIDDKIQIDSNKNELIPNNIYNIVYIDKNRIYINLKPVITVAPNNSLDINGNAAATSFDSVLTAQTANDEINNINNIQNVRGLEFNKSDNDNFSLPRPKIHPFLNPDFYVSKIIERERLEYYVKTLEVIDIIDELDECAFSSTCFGEKVKNYFLNHNFDITSLTNNKGEPITDVYIGIIKNGSFSAQQFGNIESHFETFIDFVEDNDGIEKITDNSKQLNKKPNIGDVFFHSICENTTEELTETEIQLIEHRFIHNDVLFNYKPFYKVPLKLVSTYIEDGDDLTLNIPPYSIFSNQRQKYIWRDIFDIGIADENGNVIDFPFMNGSFYVYKNIDLIVKPEARLCRKYTLNKNDITSSGTDISNEINDIMDSMDLGENEDTPKDIKPYNTYKDTKC